LWKYTVLLWLFGQEFVSFPLEWCTCASGTQRMEISKQPAAACCTIACNPMQKVSIHGQIRSSKLHCPPYVRFYSKE
jgi:hypothetical protein